MTRITAILFAAAVLSAPLVEPAVAQIVAGNAAFRGADDVTAEMHYAAAAERTTDPGLVAFNRAAVALRKKDYRAADRLCQQVLDDRDAPPERRAKAFYNRGICLLNRDTSASTFRTAIACFEQAVDLLGPTDPLTADARHNLELAKVLWATARGRDKPPPPANDLPPDAPQDPPAGNDPTGRDPGGSDEGPGGTPGQKPIAVAGKPTGGKKPRETDRQAAGAGSLPVILDPDRPDVLTADEARAVLVRVAARLDDDRRANARMTAPPERPHVRDW